MRDRAVDLKTNPYRRAAPWQFCDHSLVITLNELRPLATIRTRRPSAADIMQYDVRALIGHTQASRFGNNTFLGPTDPTIRYS